jgi:prevent-host-death family protein
VSSDQYWAKLMGASVGQTVSRIALGNGRVVSMRELNQRTSQVIDEINEGSGPAVVTKHGRIVALITPLAGRRIESLVLSEDPALRERLEQADGALEDRAAHGVDIEQARTLLSDD